MPSTLPKPLQKPFNQGVAWIRDHLLNHAELGLRRVLVQAPGHAPTQRFLGVALVKLGRTDEGLEMLRAAAASDPEDWGIRSDLAVALGAPGAPPIFSTDDRTREFNALDYPYRATIRYGAGRPSHPELTGIIEKGRRRYEAVIDDMRGLQSDFTAVPLGGSYDDRDPFWINAWFPPLDTMVLTHFLKKFAPPRFVEIGSGVSTKVARRAVELYGLKTHLTSIDPQPRNEIDTLCDQVIRQPLEETDLSLFEALEPGDILFLDSSHRSFQGSDVTVFFMEILPRVKPGVILHVHDIYLPDDYISGHVDRLWNEQYLLATALLFGENRFEILFPCWFAHRDPALFERAASALRKGPLETLNLYGASFWFKKI
ncbi:class I SAM-dependent methyltransferase [Brevundimonas sp. TWP2-3-2]|uniref:class I SAM-dependent methyltransferase n=1 Tax=unclassified Brevundimonas TaxID=2622653 RepID=UPI003CF6AD1F